MSKFCGSCGAQLNDDVKVCGFCGVAVSDDNTESTSSSSVPGIETESQILKNEKTKKIIKLAGIGIGAIIALIIVISIISSFTGYKGAVRKLMNAFEDYDVDTLISMSSSILSATPDFDDEDFEEYISETVSGRLDYYESEVGTDIKISYEIVNAHNLPERKIDQLVSLLENYGYEPDNIKKVKQIDLEITVKGSRREESYDNDNLYMIKEDGKWKALYTGYMSNYY